LFYIIVATIIAQKTNNNTLFCYRCYLFIIVICYGLLCFVMMSYLYYAFTSLPFSLISTVKSSSFYTVRLLYYNYLTMSLVYTHSM